jgi:hypothetical protein
MNFNEEVTEDVHEAKRKIDIVTFEVLRNSFNAICDEAAENWKGWPIRIPSMKGEIIRWQL